MQNKKVLFLVDRLAVADGGPPQALVRLCRSLASEFEVQPSIICRETTLEEIPVPHSIKVYRLPVSGKNPISWLRQSSVLKKLIRSHDAFIVNGIWGPLDGLMVRLAWTNDTPIFVRTCGMLQTFILQRHRWKKILAQKTYTNHNLENARAIIVNTSIEGEQVKDVNYKNNQVVIPNGVELDQFPVIEKTMAHTALGTDEKLPTLLYLSRIHPKKGLHLLMDALDRIKLPDTGIQLLLCGRYDFEDYKATIQEGIQKLHSKVKVHYLGEVSGNHRLNAFAAADVFVLPSYSEGFSNAILEAMANRLPVIITEGCNFPEVSKMKAGWVIPPQVDAIEEALGEWLKNPDEAKIFGSNGRQLIEDCYSQKTIAQAYYNLIKDTVT